MQGPTNPPFLWLLLAGRAREQPTLGLLGAPMQENPDLFKWLTGQLEAPAAMKSNHIFQASLNASLRWQVQVHSTMQL